MKEIADSGLRIANSGIQIDAPLQPPVNRFSPAIYPAASRDPKSAILNPHSIELHIDTLVLHEFPPADRYSIADAVELELTRLFAELGLPFSLRRPAEVERINGAFHASRSANHQALGVEVARAIYIGLRL